MVMNYRAILKLLKGYNPYVCGEKWSEEEKEILKGLLNRMRPLSVMREMSKMSKISKISKISGRSVYAVSCQRSEIKKEARNDKR